MRIWASSDLHIDYEMNAAWVAGLSLSEYCEDLLILAGDVSSSLRSLGWCLTALVARFKKVLFVPGNHDLWAVGDGPAATSLGKLYEVAATVESSGASLKPYHGSGILVVPLLSWYDYSFGEPSEYLKRIWADYYACRWPPGVGEPEIARHFGSCNVEPIATDGETVITFSHFLPRIDLMPGLVPARQKLLYPVLGSTLIEHELRRHGADIHVYGHSHLNRRVVIDGVLYINNAFGYPNERGISAKRLLCIYEGKAITCNEESPSCRSN